MSPQTRPAELFVVWQNNQYDGLSHAITDEEFAFGEGRDYGHFEAVCGDTARLGGLVQGTSSEVSAVREIPGGAST